MKNTVLAIISGLLLSFAWPTEGSAFLLFFALAPLLLAIEDIIENGKSKKGLKILGLAYLSFVIWNFFSTWWLHHADFYAGLFAVLANSLLLSLLILIYYYSRTKINRATSNIFFVALWISFESFHQNWDLSWPWLNLGNGFSEYYKWIQWYEYTGVFGGSLWVWLTNFEIVNAILKYRKSNNKLNIAASSIRLSLLIAVPIIFSYSIYNNYQEDQSNSTEVVIVQPNLDPYSEKFRIPDLDLAEQLCELANEKLSPSTEFVFGPETSMPGAMRMDNLESERPIKLIKAYSDSNNLNFITGATLIKWYKEKESATETSNFHRRSQYWYDISNSAIEINEKDSVDIYHKSKLVVGVEHMPFRDFIKPLLGDFIINLGGTVGTHLTQKERSIFKSYRSDFAVAPIICYESVYGDFVTEYVRNGANFLGVITNDGWWQNSQGHKQHLSFSRLRAIENRRYVVRSANTGVSAIVNQRGDIIESLEYEKTGSISGQIYKNDKLTIYSEFGDYIARVAKYLMIILFLYVISRKRASSVY
jgi:apolipoprotein N-acyltransferase